MGGKIGSKGGVDIEVLRVVVWNTSIVCMHLWKLFHFSYLVLPPSQGKVIISFFTGLAISAVGRTAHEVVIEVMHLALRLHVLTLNE